MTMIYELWDVQSGNLIEEFGTESEALAAVQGYLDANGPDLLDDLALNPVPSTGLVGATALPPVLKGMELLRRLPGTSPRADSAPRRVTA